MKPLIFSLIALSLPILGRFQETKVFQGGKIIFEQSTYGQELAAELMIVAAIVLVVAAWNESKRIENRRMARLVRLAPALFALPASWQNWSVSRFGDGRVYTEIKSGLGGPMTNLLLVAAAVLFIAMDAYWRQRETA
jgi:hypothetical protein